jgi:hypothetical protein
VHATTHKQNETKRTNKHGPLGEFDEALLWLHSLVDAAGLPLCLVSSAGNMRACKQHAIEERAPPARTTIKRSHAGMQATCDQRACIASSHNNQQSNAHMQACKQRRQSRSLAAGEAPVHQTQHARWHQTHRTRPPSNELHLTHYTTHYISAAAQRFEQTHNAQHACLFEITSAA